MPGVHALERGGETVEERLPRLGVLDVEVEVQRDPQGTVRPGRGDVVGGAEQELLVGGEHGIRDERRVDPDLSARVEGLLVAHRDEVDLREDAAREPQTGARAHRSHADVQHRDGLAGDAPREGHHAEDHRERRVGIPARRGVELFDDRAAAEHEEVGAAQRAQQPQRSAPVSMTSTSNRGRSCPRVKSGS